MQSHRDILHVHYARTSVAVSREKWDGRTVLIIWMIGNTGVDSISSFNKSGCDSCDVSRIVIGGVC